MLRSADRQPECFANPTAVVTAYAVIQIIPSPKSPPRRGLFVACRCVLRVKPVGGLQIIRLHYACNLRLPGWSLDANSRVYMQPERSANSPLRRRRARYFRQSLRIDRWRANPQTATMPASKNGIGIVIEAQKTLSLYYDKIRNSHSRQRPYGCGQPRQIVEARGRQHFVQGRSTQRGCRTYGVRPPVRASDVPRHEQRARLRRTGTNGLRREQRLYQQRLHRFLHNAAAREYRDGAVVGERPHAQPRPLARGVRHREVGGHRGV